MGDVLRWVLLGITIGFGLHWLVDRLIWARGQGEAPPVSPETLGPERTEPAEPDPPRMEPATPDAPGLAGLPPGVAEKLQAVGITSLAGRSAEEILAALDAQPWDNYDVEGWLAATNPDSTSDLTLAGLTEDHAACLKSAGITTLSGVAAMDPDELLQTIGAQPWDMIDGNAIIAKAKELL